MRLAAALGIVLAEIEADYVKQIQFAPASSGILAIVLQGSSTMPAALCG
jgi:hypothetical protein